MAASDTAAGSSMNVARLTSDSRTAASRGRVPRTLALARHLLLVGSVTEQEARRHVRIVKGFDRELRRLRSEGLVVEPIPEGAWHRSGYRVLVLRYYLRSIPAALLEDVDRTYPR